MTECTEESHELHESTRILLWYLGVFAALREFFFSRLMIRSKLDWSIVIESTEAVNRSDRTAILIATALFCIAAEEGETGGKQGRSLGPG
jgi:hypothetical protein